VLRNRRIHLWLVHCADPVGPHGAPPPAVLSPQELQQLVREADAHAVIPALIRNWPEFAEGPDYGAARDEALARRRVLFTLAMMLRRHSDALLDGMRGLPAAIVKGRTFARTIYPDAALRSFTDVDLLVDPSAVRQVSAVLAAQGFKVAEHDPERMEAKWVHTANPSLLVEVHTNMVHHPGLRESISLTFDDVCGNMECPAVLLAIAAVHGALHQFERLQQVVDICQAARALKTAEEEQRFERLVKRIGGRLAAIAGLQLAHRLFCEPRCSEIAGHLGSERYAGLSRLLISPEVVLSTKSGERSLYSWRRKIFRDLLKRGGTPQPLASSGGVR
jgi:hypothetical protein